MYTKEQILEEVFGYTNFRKGQEEIVTALLSGQDVLGVMPTGAGKSICYQLPALLFEGVTLVISPLISLMKDQVTALCHSGVKAAYINSSLSFPQYCKVMERMEQGAYQIVYVAPERLMTESFLRVVSRVKISFVAVDEAHCVSQWGQDFRPGYLNVHDFIDSLPVRPVVAAFTATATGEVKEDIVRMLELKTPYILTTGFDRPNLRFSVCIPKKRREAVLDYVESHRDKSGIIYCSTRKVVEELCFALQELGISATRYHAGLDDHERQQNQEKFIRDETPIMVATNAFGMGIDKSNVSFVAHMNMPKNLESYYQEAGRAGRDGGNGECILFYSPADIQTNRYFIENSEPPEEMTTEEIALFKEREYRRLRYMTFYATTDGCLRQFILDYFGEKSPDQCGNCSSCDGGLVPRDVTVDAQKVLSCIARCKERYGSGVIIDVLRGSKNEQLRRLELDKLSTYGIMKGTKKADLLNLVQVMTAKGLLTVLDGEYPILKLNEDSWAVLRGQKTVIVRTADSVAREISSGPRREVGEQNPLFLRLKTLRSELAKKENVPAYIIFTDSTLKDMSSKQPTTMSGFLAVSGVGYAKQEKYGKAFLQVITEYMAEQPLSQ